MVYREGGGKRSMNAGSAIMLDLLSDDPPCTSAIIPGFAFRWGPGLLASAKLQRDSQGQGFLNVLFQPVGIPRNMPNPC